jgi:hypothetical protein
MNSKKGRIGLVSLLVILLSLSACGSAADEAPETGPVGTVPEDITCEVYYRPTAGQGLEGSTVTLSTDGDRVSLDFDNMRFEAVFLSDVGEGKSLAIATGDLDSGEELSRALYQIDQVQGLIDQFIGGHGFTGLAYVYHPASTAEIQYFCLAG